MMIELGDNNLITLRQRAAECAGEMHCERRHVGAERNLTRRCIQKISKRLTRFRDCFVSLGARRIRPVGVGVVMIEIIQHRITDAPGSLSSTRSVEVRDRMPVMNSLERRELRANLLE